MSTPPAPHAQGPSGQGRPGRVWRRVGGVLLVLGVLAAAGFAWLWFAPCGFGGCAPVSDLERFQAEGSVLLDVNGEPFGTLATVDRRVVSLDSLPPHLPRAFLAAEDRRFYDHGGVDWWRMGGAFLRNLRAGGVEEGGSTITMQLARNLFPEHLPYTERSVRRKLLEIRVARQIERSFPKEKILELYLNHIYLGEGAYGVEAAARRYFGKPAAELDLAEAALLGGLPQAPSRINPRESRDAAIERRNLVLREMAEAGYVSPAEAEAAREVPVHLAERTDEEDERAPYFRTQVRRELEAHVGDRLYTAGLRVYTTLDPEMQAAAEEELAEQLGAVEAGRFGHYPHPTYPEAKGDAGDGTTPYLQGAVILLDAETGAVRALVGGRDWKDSRFDRATQALRQPGSAFKPFVYLAALERGRAPTHRVEDAPLTLTVGGRSWEPKNYTGRYDGSITLREALTRSKNTATVRLAQEVGMSPVVRTARALGIRSEISPLPSTALGASEVRPVELAQAYAAFANGGYRVEPRYIRRIEDRHGHPVWEAPAERERAVDPDVAFVLTSMLRDVVDRGTGNAVRAAGFRGPAAGKTGTTNAATDVWFAGYTPELVGVVWMGLDRPQTIVRGASGGTLAAPVWGRLMRRVYAGRPTPRPWSPPPGVAAVEVDRATGLAVDAACAPQGPTYTEYFAGSRPPRQPCYPDARYPGPAGLDTVWVDEEWGAGTEDDVVAPGIVWPELAEIRRRRAEGETVVPDTLLPSPRPRTEPEVPEPVEPRPERTREADPPRVLGTPVRPPPAPDPTPELVGRPVQRPPPGTLRPR